MGALSADGGFPKAQWYSRLNWVPLEYPTAYAAAVTVCVPDESNRRASSSRSRFWNWTGVAPVTAFGHIIGYWLAAKTDSE